MADEQTDHQATLDAGRGGDDAYEGKVITLDDEALAGVTEEEVDETNVYDFGEPEDDPMPVSKDADAGDGTEAAPDASDADAADEVDTEMDDALLDRAAAAGIRPSEARAYGSPDSLEMTIAVLERRTAELGGKGEPESEQVGAIPELTAYESKLDPELHDPEVADEFKALNEHWQAQLAPLRDAVVRLNAQTETRQVEQDRQWLDEQYAALGPEWEAVVGKGPTAELSPRSKAWKARAGIDTEIKVAAQIREQSNLPAVEKTALFKRALMGIHGDHMKTIARKEVTEKLDKRSGQQISRPTSRSGSPVKRGRATAIAAGNALLAERGVGIGATDDDEDPFAED